MAKRSNALDDESVFGAFRASLAVDTKQQAAPSLTPTVEERNSESSVIEEQVPTQEQRAATTVRPAERTSSAKKSSRGSGKGNLLSGNDKKKDDKSKRNQSKTLLLSAEEVELLEQILEHEDGIKSFSGLLGTIIRKFLHENAASYGLHYNEDRKD